MAHRLAGIYPAIFIHKKGVIWKEKVLSVFIDESGDLGQYNPASSNYYVAMVLHNQEIDISKNIDALDRQISNWGYPEHTIHTGPLIRRESVYKNDLREDRKDLICTVEAIAQKNVFTKSESEFFHSKRDFNKNIYKNIAKKKL